MNRTIILTVLAVAALCSGCGSSRLLSEDMLGGGPSLTVVVEPGDHYRHRLQVMPFLSIRNPPQMAVWLESSDGRYLETLLITRKTGEQPWRRAPGDHDTNGDLQRPEALPVWSSRTAESGRLCVDGATSSTPKAGFEAIQTAPDAGEFVVWMEVNHSTDFNDAYPVDAGPGDAGYSGGSWGSGQPSLVYKGVLGGSPAVNRTRLVLVGHGSPDGSDGLVHSDMTGITDAMSIVDSAVVQLGTRQTR